MLSILQPQSLRALLKSFQILSPTFSFVLSERGDDISHRSFAPPYQLSDLNTFDVCNAILGEEPGLLRPLRIGLELDVREGSLLAKSLGEGRDGVSR